MTTWALGDLHGCLEPLERLLEAVRFDPAADRLWFVGDLANRGPRPLETMRFVRALGDAAVTVLGNHDLHLLAVVHGARKASAKDTLAEVLAADDLDALETWLRSRPLLHVDAALGATLVHAGIHPHWSLGEARRRARELEALLPTPRFERFLGRMYGDAPAHWSPDLDKHARRRFAVNAFTRMRYCTRDGALELSCSEAPAKAPARLVPWYLVPDRVPLGTRVVFGHWSSHPAMSPADVLPLDRGCVWDGALAAHALESGETVSVSCRPRASRPTNR